MLEALLFKKQGRLLKFNTPDPSSAKYAPALWDKTLVNVFDDKTRRLTGLSSRRTPT